MSSFMEGVWGKMIENTLKTQSGHIEIHGTGWWDDKIIDNFLTMDSSEVEALRRLENVENVSPRIETFALASFGSTSKGVAVVAVSPKQENAKSRLASRIVEGNYLSETDSGVLIGRGIAKYLKATVGDTLAFMGQGHFGASAAGLFPVRGILHLAITEMDNSLAYITLPTAQPFIDMPNGYSGILISLKNDKKLDATIEAVKNVVQADSYDVLSWHFTMKKLMETAESDKAFSKIVLFILYLIVGFGILGTVIMLTNERQKEFRTMISLGMNRGKLARVVTLELMMMTSIGLLVGFALALPIACYFHANPIVLTGEMAMMYLDNGMEPIMPTSVDVRIFVVQVAIVLFLSLIAAVYPIRKIKKLKLHG